MQDGRVDPDRPEDETETCGRTRGFREVVGIPQLRSRRFAGDRTTSGARPYRGSVHPGMERSYTPSMCLWCVYGPVGHRLRVSGPCRLCYYRRSRVREQPRVPRVGWEERSSGTDEFHHSNRRLGIEGPLNLI